MSLSATTQYDFGDVPIDAVDGGTSILVSGPRDGGLEELFHSLLAAAEDDEGVVAITSDDGSRSFERAHRSAAGLGRGGDIGVVDCSGDSGIGTDDDAAVADPSDLTAVNMQFSALCDELRYDGTEHLRTGLLSVSPLCAACEDMRDVYRFVQNITSRTRRNDGLFVCAIDPEADTGQFGDGQNIAAGLEKAFAGHVELRREGGRTEIRTDGLDAGADEWQRVTL